jgi:transcriptional regulator with XRE-family HTH domain
VRRRPAVPAARRSFDCSCRKRIASFPLTKTISPALQRNLAEYGIGARLRALRLRRKLGLVELARHSGLSPALLSKLERGRMFPTLPTLLRIAMVFGVGLDHFFSGAEPRRVLGVVRAAERERFQERLGRRELLWEFECLDFTATERRLNAYRVRFVATSPKPRTHEHAGAEFLHLLAGRLSVVVGGVDHLLGAGDSIYFDSSQPHGYARRSRGPALAVVVTTG